MATRRRRRGLASTTTQRAVRFIVGIGLLVYEATLRSGDPRWPLLVLYAGMMGLPLAEKADELRRSEQTGLAFDQSGEEGGP